MDIKTNNMRIAESELIINSDGTIFHLHIKPEELADTIILVGDPSRVEMVAEFFEEKEFKRTSREFVTITGKYKGKRISVISSGIGTDNIDIVMTELDALANIDFTTREPKTPKKCLNILRIGTSGGIQPNIPLGSFVFSHISVGCDGLINWYTDRDNISILPMEEAFKKHVGWNKHLPDPYFAKAGTKMCELFKDSTIKGVTISASGFYGPQGRVIRIPLAMPNMLNDFESFEYEGWKITNFEMEGSAIAGLASHLGHNAATICCIIANRHLKSSNPDYKPQVKKLVELALNKLVLL